MRRQIEVAFTVIGIVAILSANAVGAEWTDGTVGVTWELAPPSTAPAGEEFDATAAANYDPNTPAGTEWEYTTVDITFEWEANPDGNVSAGRQPTGGSGGGVSYKSEADVTYPDASATQDDKTVRVRAHVTGSILDYGDDGEKGTGDDVTYTIDEWSSWKEAKLSIFSADIQIRDWRQEGGTWVADWSDEIVAVAGDEVTLRACEVELAGMDYAWDWEHYLNTDHTDANQNGVDELIDDAQSTFRQGSHYFLLPYDSNAYMFPLRIVHCSVSDSESVVTDSANVHMHEAYVCSGNMSNSGLWGIFDDWEQDAMNADVADVRSVLEDMHYRAEPKYKVNFYDVQENLFPFYEVFYYVGHGCKKDGDNGEGYFNSYYGDRVSAARESHRTPMGGERTYRFVFINACNSAQWDFKQQFAANCLVGWDGSVTAAHARAFSYYFWRFMRDGYDAFNAVSAAHMRTIGYVPGSAIPQCQGNIILKKN